jgi:GntR family transcriptional regulator
MLLHVNASLGIPIYLQVEAQLKHAIASGVLREGDALPSVRKLAADLRINPNTIARAYQNLERDGVVRTVPGGGTYVADHHPGLLKAEKMRRLRPLARQLAVEAAQLRFSSDELLDLLHEELRELRGKL